MKNGDFATFYENGVIKEASEYINGQKNGVSTTYYENGEIKEIGKYENAPWLGRFLYSKLKKLKFILS